MTRKIRLNYALCVAVSLSHARCYWLIWACFLSLARSKLRLCSANHRPGYFSNLPCDWLSTARAYSKLETENRPRPFLDQDKFCLASLNQESYEMEIHVYLSWKDSACKGLIYWEIIMHIIAFMLWYKGLKSHSYQVNHAQDAIINFQGIVQSLSAQHWSLVLSAGRSYDGISWG